MTVHEYAGAWVAVARESGLQSALSRAREDILAAPEERDRMAGALRLMHQILLAPPDRDALRLLVSSATGDQLARRPVSTPALRRLSDRVQFLEAQLHEARERARDAVVLEEEVYELGVRKQRLERELATLEESLRAIGAEGP